VFLKAARFRRLLLSQRQRDEVYATTRKTRQLIVQCRFVCATRDWNFKLYWNKHKTEHVFLHWICLWFPYLWLIQRNKA